MDFTIMAMFLKNLQTLTSHDKYLMYPGGMELANSQAIPSVFKAF
jgi:hypothetical protein